MLCALFMHRRMLAALTIALLPAPAIAATLVENARASYDAPR